MEMQPNETREQRFYVLEVLQSAARSIESIVDSMPVYRRRIDKYQDSDRARAAEIYNALAKERRNLVSAVGSARYALMELGEDAKADYAKTLGSHLSTFALMTPDYSKLVSILKDFSADLNAPQTTNAAIIGRLMNHVKMGHYPTDLENVGHILRGVAFPEGVTTNLLDPCCGDGTALRKLATGNNCYTYGAELDESRAEKAQDRLHRVGFGSFFHTEISREAFHLIFLNPPYLSVLTEGGGRSRDEKRFLIDALPRLTVGGLLVYIVPYFRLTPDICRILCDNFTDLSVHRFVGKEFDRFHQVAVMGIRRPERIDGSKQATAFEASVSVPSDIPQLTELAEGRYALPDKLLEVQRFKGARFNELELARQLKASDSFDRLFAKTSLDRADRRPLLPLSIAQVGLIGGSGHINGLIDCDYPHIIKGRIVKQRRIAEEQNYNSKGKYVSTETRETISNKLIFNILTPSGFLSLA